MPHAFVIVGRTASATGEYLLDDLPGTSGRLDVLLRCIRAALLTSHGVRTDVVVSLVLQSGPRIVRIDGALVRFLRPDERQLAVLLKKVLALEAPADGSFIELRRGIALARGDVARALEGAKRLFVLDETAERDLRDARGGEALDGATFILGDHVGLAPEVRALLDAAGALPVHIGPVSIHADDAVAIVTNEIDRARTQALRGTPS